MELTAPNDVNHVLRLTDLLIERTDVAFSEKKRLEDEYNIGIEDDGQLEITLAVRDNSIENLAISCARGIGKSWSTALAIVDLCRHNPDFYIGVCAPKEGQAQRLLRECVKILKKAKPEVGLSVDWRVTTNLHIEFKNGSYINGFSASEHTSSEGDHYHVIINDESHLTSGMSLSQKIMPMLGSYSTARIVKIGVALYKNHFYQAIRSNNYRKIILNWTKSARLKLSGVVTINGVDYPRYAFNRMPLSLKLKVWPNLPMELQTDGDMTEEDFRTQYMVEWVDSISQLLSELDQLKFLGEHLSLPKAQLGEVYYFGLDTAGGSPVPGKKYLDFTSLAIWRRTPDAVKEKVFNRRWKGEIMEQISDIRALIHPREGLFPCQFGLADYSNVGIVIVEAFKKEGIAIEGVVYAHTAPATGKNYKNAMADYYLYEMRSNRVHYPRIEDVQANKEMLAGMNEWFTIERRQGTGLNDKIEAPEGKMEDEDDVYHDDIANSDLLAVYASDKGGTISAKNKDQSGYQIPLGVAGMMMSAAQPGLMSTGVYSGDISPTDSVDLLKQRGEMTKTINEPKRPWWKEGRG